MYYPSAAQKPEEPYKTTTAKYYEKPTENQYYKESTKEPSYYPSATKRPAGSYESTNGRYSEKPTKYNEESTKKPTYDQSPTKKPAEPYKPTTAKYHESYPQTTSKYDAVPAPYPSHSAPYTPPYPSHPTPYGAPHPAQHPAESFSHYSSPYTTTPYEDSDPHAAIPVAPAPPPHVVFVNKEKRAECFAAEASVTMRVHGRGRMDSLQPGMEILSRSPLGELRWESVVGFLHMSRDDARHASQIVTIEHSAGELRATQHHILYVYSEGSWRSGSIGQLKLGDLVRPTASEATMPFRVLAVRRDLTTQGLVAPLTLSGNMNVDGVETSVYAKSLQMEVPHVAVHAAWYSWRLLVQISSLVSQPVAQLRLLLLPTFILSSAGVTMKAV
eukprot:TRINITY_DN5080_c0_g1_i1.p1 TRINITY_DN5080_c0_g1~~TRINITY_DN5080_c0_g1_i1.p1  ORF type:complete len:386 (-),score=55.00 TRINITY_DN5080_c0_g1_i1:296-1453(-)